MQVACRREGGRAAFVASGLRERGRACGTGRTQHVHQPACKAASPMPEGCCTTCAAQHGPKERARPTCAAAEAGTPWSCTYARGRPGPPAPLHPCAQRWHPQATARGCLLGRSPPPAHTRARARARTAHAVYDRCTAWQASRACGLDGGNHCYVHRYAPAH